MRRQPVQFYRVGCGNILRRRAFFKSAAAPAASETESIMGQQKRYYL
jgi:hypothetical protein